MSFELFRSREVVFVLLARIREFDGLLDTFIGFHKIHRRQVIEIFGNFEFRNS